MIKQEKPRKTESCDKHGHKRRELSEHEQKEEDIYRHQLKSRHSYLPGKHPLDVWKQKQKEKEGG